MPRILNVTQTVSFVGENTQYSTQRSIAYDNPTDSLPLVPAAKPGDITARSSDSAGTLVMDAGHGFVDTDIVDLYFGTLKRVGVVLGTPTGDSFPISGGSGDPLPETGSLPMPATAMKRHSEDREFAGNALQFIFISSPVPAWVTFTETDGTTVLVSIPLTADPSGAYTYLWDIQGDPTGNPLAGASVGKVLFSQASEIERVITVRMGTN